MPISRAKKEESVEDLRESFDSAQSVVVTHYSGLTVPQINDLRNKMRVAGARFSVAKNTLARRAVEGTPYESMAVLFKGPTALAFSPDPVGAAKVATDFAKGQDKFKVVGGALGRQVLDADGVKALANLPSLDELRAKLCGLLQAPAAQLVTVTQAPAAKLARVFAAYAEKSEAA